MQRDFPLFPQHTHSLLSVTLWERGQTHKVHTFSRNKRGRGKRSFTLSKCSTFFTLYITHHGTVNWRAVLGGADDHNNGVVVVNVVCGVAAASVCAKLSRDGQLLPHHHNWLQPHPVLERSKQQHYLLGQGKKSHSLSFSVLGVVPRVRGSS